MLGLRSTPEEDENDESVELEEKAKLECSARLEFGNGEGSILLPTKKSAGTILSIDAKLARAASMGRSFSSKKDIFFSAIK